MKKSYKRKRKFCKRSSSKHYKELIITPKELYSFLSDIQKIGNGELFEIVLNFTFPDFKGVLRCNDIMKAKSNLEEIKKLEIPFRLNIPECPYYLNICKKSISKYLKITREEKEHIPLRDEFAETNVEIITREEKEKLTLRDDFVETKVEELYDEVDYERGKILCFCFPKIIMYCEIKENSIQDIIRKLTMNKLLQSCDIEIKLNQLIKAASDEDLCKFDQYFLRFRCNNCDYW